MSFRVVWHNSAQRAVRTWGLPDEVFIEMRLQVNQLRDRPADRLVRIEEPFSGMGYPVRFIDPFNRLCVHTFLFHVVYSQDEENVFVATGTYSRRIG